MPSEVYSNAPITEAALDIRVRGAADKGPEALMAAFDSAYPVLFQRPVKMEVTVEGHTGENNASATTSNTLLGFAYKSVDEKQVYQFRTDGFTHNRLSPYKEWNEFAAEAKRLWTTYKGALHPQRIELVGLNYLNEIFVPFGADFSDYFKTYVEVPANLPQNLLAFNFGYQLMLPENQGFLFIAQSYGVPKLANHSTVNLNIQAFKQLDLDTEDPDCERLLWSTFDALRKAKSDAFEACITDEVRKMIR